jgi:predicted AlkP superfamily pyrophosphatase or phosphodiesterase
VRYPIHFSGLPQRNERAMRPSGFRFHKSIRDLQLLAAICLALCFATAAAAQEQFPVIHVDHGPNAADQLAKHYVILISFDGFRYDYAQRYQTQNILALETKGAWAPEGMIPAFPSVTYPNHYTLVTGLYPGHHGIVQNEFYDPQRGESYRYTDPKSANDGTWYGGTPLWVLAEQQGMRSASIFWPASAANIQGVLPTYYMKYDDKFTNDMRMQRALEWLRLPADQRPHFITLYFGDVDHYGHKYGPDSPELINTVHELDSELGRLMQGLKTINLPVDVIVVADHGMAQVPPKWIELDQRGLDVSLLEKYWGTLLYAKTEEGAKKIYEELQPGPEYKVYRHADLPERLHLSMNPRIGDPVIYPLGPYAIHVNNNPKYPAPDPGAHGFDPAVVPEMKALFVAAGPEIRANLKVPSFENVNIYPLIAHMLGLDYSAAKAGPIDGDLLVLQPILKKPN